MNSYNLVGSVSSFLITSVILNSNLVNFFEYNIYPMNEKIYHNYYNLFEYSNNFTIYKMEPSAQYITKMKIFKNNKAQRKLLLKEKCINYFQIIRIGF